MAGEILPPFFYHTARGATQKQTIATTVAPRYPTHLHIMNRGIRNNNPCNIRRTTTKWQGMSVEQTDKYFVQFVSKYYGIRAAIIILKNYYRQHHINTLHGIISRWAPLSENDTQRYIAYMSECTEWEPFRMLDMGDPATIARIVCAMAFFESGMVLNYDSVLNIAKSEVR